MMKGKHACKAVRALCSGNVRMEDCAASIVEATHTLSDSQVTYRHVGWCVGASDAAVDHNEVLVVLRINHAC